MRGLYKYKFETNTVEFKAYDYYRKPHFEYYDNVMFYLSLSLVIALVVILLLFLTSKGLSQEQITYYDNGEIKRIRNKIL